MQRRSVDVAIIGAGTAGLTARRAALKAGAREVVLIEGGIHGTTCARVGCMPSKLLVAASDAAHQATVAEIFGVNVSSVEIDGAAVMRRVRAERDRFTNFVVHSIDELADGQRLDGWARFVAPTHLEVTLPDGHHQLVEARAVVIAAGTSPWIPPGLRDLGDRLLTNETVFELPTLPRSIAIVGTGVIGMELGQAFSRLGVRTTLLNRSDRIGPLTDPEVAAVAREVFAAELDLRQGIEDLIGELDENGDVRLEWNAQGIEHSECFEAVLVATGRRPNEVRLGLDALELPRTGGGHLAFDPRTMQLGDLPIFIAGDFNDDRTLLHEAADEGRIAGRNAATFPTIEPSPRRTPLSITFTDPNLAVVGAPVHTLDPERHAHGEVDYGRQGRARVMAQNRGCVRIWADIDSGRLRAAEMVGPRVEHTAHLLAWAIQNGLTVERALGMPFYHPVIEEGIRTALQDLSRTLDARRRTDAPAS